MTHIPTSENEFLGEILVSLRKRHKALKHKAMSMKCEKILERTEFIDIEKIEFDMESKLEDVRRLTRLFAWGDRWLWIWTGSMKRKRWIWEFEAQGRLLGSLSGRDVISAVEKTHASIDSNDPALFNSIWRKMLATGPVPIS